MFGYFLGKSRTSKGRTWAKNWTLEHFTLHSYGKRNSNHFQALMTFPDSKPYSVTICIYPPKCLVKTDRLGVWDTKETFEKSDRSMGVENPQNRANPNPATVSPFRANQCASLMVFQNPRKLWLHGISFSFAEEWMKSMQVHFTMWRKVFLVLVNFCCSLEKKNYIENAFKTPHNYMYNCSSVALVLERVQS